MAEIPLNFYYSDGTMTLTNGSDLVTGTFTSWDPGVQPMDIVFPNDGQSGVSVVDEVLSAGEMRLAKPWTGPTLTDVPYFILRWIKHTDPRRYGLMVSEYLARLKQIPTNFEEIAAEVSADRDAVDAALATVTAAAAEVEADRAAAVTARSDAQGFRNEAQTFRNQAQQAAADAQAGTVADGAVTDSKVAANAGIASSKLAFNDGGTGATALSLQTYLRQRSIDITTYGAIGDGNAANAAANATALQRAIDRAVATGRAIYIPPGVFVVGSTVAIPSKPVVIFGAGESRSTLRSYRLDGPMFRWTITGTNTENVTGSLVKDLRLDAYFEAGDVYDNSAAFYIEGDNTCYFGYNRFQNLTVAGFRNGLMRVLKATQTTAFGQESLVTWNSFQSITLTGFSKPCYFGFLFDLGSGTGNSWGDIRSSVDGAVLRFNGGGCVVGDILLTHSHLGGRIAGAAAIWIGDNTVYRQRIAIVATQLDANLDKPFRLSSVGSIPYTNITFNGNNVGGNVTIYDDVPPLRSSQIVDQEVGEWRVGRFHDIAVAGAQTLTLFTVDIPNYTGTEITVTVSGLVGGVQGGVRRAVFLMARGGSSASVTTLSDNSLAGDGGAVAGTFYTISAVVSGGTVVIQTTFTPGSAGSKLDAQLRAVGGTIRVKRH